MFLRPSAIFPANLDADPSPFRRAAAWLAALLVAVGLGYLRVVTDAEYAFASAVILPVVVLTWLGGLRDGIGYAALASLMWISADLLADRHLPFDWLHVLNGLIRFAVYALIAGLIAALRAAMLREQKFARQDALTGLLNRRVFFEIGEAEVERSRRYGQAIAIAFLDLDNFKQLNDARGHEAGDRALQAVARAMSGSLRVTDHIARIGGDEFAVMLPETTFDASTKTCIKLANTINQALEQFAPVTVSIGVAWFETATGDFDDMVKAADALMYEIKRSGKQGVSSQRIGRDPGG